MEVPKAIIGPLTEPDFARLVEWFQKNTDVKITQNDLDNCSSIEDFCCDPGDLDGPYRHVLGYATKDEYETIHLKAMESNENLPWWPDISELEFCSVDTFILYAIGGADESDANVSSMEDVL